MIPMSKLYDEKPFIYPERKPSSEDEYFDNGWSVRREGKKFIFCYISGQLQGELKKIEISEVDFNAAKNGRISFDELCRKYNVH